MKIIAITLLLMLSGCAVQSNVGVAGKGGNHGSIFGIGMTTGIGF